MTAITDQLTVENLESGKIMDGIAPASKKTYHKCFFLSNPKYKGLYPLIQKHFEHHLYQEHIAKFSGWQCMEQLDLSATAS